MPDIDLAWLFFGYFVVPAVDALKRTALATHVRGNGWVLVALALAFVVATLHALLTGGALPATEAAWVGVLEAAAIMAAWAGMFYDLSHNGGKLIGVFAHLLGAEATQHARAHLGDATPARPQLDLVRPTKDDR